MPWSNYAKDKYLAPMLSELERCDMPVLSVGPEASKRWLSQFVLRSALIVNIPDPFRQLVFSYLRRADTAVLNYSNARIELAAFLESEGRLGIAEYSRALYSLESAVAMGYQAALLLRQLHDEKPSMFAKNDGSPLFRMDRIYNAGKHADEFIANGGRFARDGTLTVWIVNQGIECREGILTFHELAGHIESLCRFAQQFAALDIPRPPEDGGQSNSPAI